MTPTRPSETASETTNIIPMPEALRPPGRPSIFSQELLEEICAIIRLDGLSDSMAALLAGVSTSTISRWKQDDENVGVALGQARAMYERERLRAIRAACKRDGSLDWRAQAWLLQKSSPEQYGPPSRRRKAAPPADQPDTELANGREVITPYELTLLQKKRAWVLERDKAAEDARKAETKNVPKIPETLEASKNNVPKFPETPHEGRGAERAGGSTAGAGSHGSSAHDPRQPGQGVPARQVLPIHSGNPFHRLEKQTNLPETPRMTFAEAERAMAEAAEFRRRVESIVFAPDLRSRLHYEESEPHWEHDAIPGQWTGA